VLDQAMCELKEGDRDALLLRFFQSRTLAEVGEVLGLSENAARMRVDRALDKLHGLLVRRGIKSTATALGLVLADQLATAVPATLASTVTSAALASAASATGARLFMGMTKIQIVIAASLVVAGGLALWSQRQTESQLQAENSALLQQTAEISQQKNETARLEADTQTAAVLRREASALDGLHAEEVQLRQAVLDRARLASADTARFQQTPPDGKPLYSIQQLDRVLWAKFRAQPVVYPADLKKIGVGGEALMEFTVRPDGTIDDIEAVKSTHDAFAVVAQEAHAKGSSHPGK